MRLNKDMKTIILSLLLALTFCSGSSSITETEESPLQFNIEGLLKCIQEAYPYVKDVIELINLISSCKGSYSIYGRKRLSHEMY